MRLGPTTLALAITLSRPLAASSQTTPAPAPRYPCPTRAESKQFDFWIGTWDVTPWQAPNPTPQQKMGVNEVYPILEHCVISENWEGARGGKGKSYNFYDTNVKHWRQIWIADGGTSLDYTGDFSDGAMRFRGWTLDAKGNRVEQKLTFFSVAPDTVRQLFEQSTDGGTTWAPTFDGRYVRRKTAAPSTNRDSQEIALGAALAEQFDQQRGLLPKNDETRKIEAYLQTIADSLGRHARRKLPWTIHYDPHAGLKSGFALPGGHIVIWGGILSYMSTEDEAAAVIAHEIIHIDDGQVSERIAQKIAQQHRDITDPSQWTWNEFGQSYGAVKENLCDYDGAKLTVQAGYSPWAYKTILESFVALGKVHAPSAPAPKAITDRITQIENEIGEFHWEARTRTRPLLLPGTGG